MTDEEKDLQTPPEGTQSGEGTTPKITPEGPTDNLPPPPPTNPEPPVNYREKFAESTRENQVLTAKVAETERQLGIAITAEPPTEAELKSEYPEWEDLTAFEKRMAIETLTLKKQARKAILLAEQATADATSEKEFKQILRAKNKDGSPKFPGLQEREDDFRAYCNMPTHKGSPLETLARAFLFDIGEKPPTPKSTPAPKPTLDRTGGGDKSANPAQISDEDAEVIRKNDPKRYERLIKSGAIKVK